MIRRIAILAGGALALTACGSLGFTDSSSNTDGAGGSPIDQVESSPQEDVPSALGNPTNPAFDAPLVDLDKIIDGGPPPDGIPPIDRPRFLTASEVDFLADDEPVLAIEVNGEHRAYPVQVMIWHEIVNDTVAGVPVTVTYCPLCNSALAYERRLGDRVLDFGTSGQLFNSSLVMYDRQTESLWTHFDGKAVVGHLTGAELTQIPVATVAWATWRDEHPDARVLSSDTGFERDYGQNPYPGYDDVDNPPFLFDGEVDDRLAGKERVLGVTAGDDAVAIRSEGLSSTEPVGFELDGEPAVAWGGPQVASSLDDRDIDRGRDVSATGVFSATLDGETLAFERRDGTVVDTGTGSTWSVLGEATAGPLAGERLEELSHVDTFWFAWAAFEPDTRLLG